MQKPSYRTSKLAIWLSSSLAWLVILALTAGAVATGQVIAFAQIALPMMVGLIAIMLGIHRGLGSLDMWTMTRSASPSSSFHPRDDPKEHGR